nr:immunoglobulin heavy chain junction region [Macaca mulatta]
CARHEPPYYNAGHYVGPMAVW